MIVELILGFIIIALIYWVFFEMWMAGREYEKKKKAKLREAKQG